MLSRSRGGGAWCWAPLRLPRAAKPESLPNEFTRSRGDEGRRAPFREEPNDVEICFANDQPLAYKVVQRLPLLANKEERSRITSNL